MSHDQFISLEIEVIRKIIADETWLEGERRGGPVSPEDPVVVERVCCIVMRIGQELRESIEGRPAMSPVTVIRPADDNQCAANAA